MVSMKQKALQTNKLKNTKSLKERFCEKYHHLSEDELNTKSNKDVYVKNNIMTIVIKRCSGKEKR